MSTKRRAPGASDEADVKAKRSRRLVELIDEYGEDENLMGVVEVVAGGVAHRVVNPLLLAQSEVFRGMLTNGLREAAQRRIELPDMSVECWQALYAYLQRGCVRVESSNAVEVLQAAHMYELPPLADAVALRIADACDKGGCDEDALINLLDLAERLQHANLTAIAARALLSVDAENERAAKAIEAIIADFQATEEALAAKAAGPLPGGYAVGEKVFFAGGSYTFPSGDKQTLGQPGEVTGRADNFPGLEVRWPGNKGLTDCRLTTLSRTPPPPLPGGYAVGDRVFFTGDSETFPRGDKLTPGQAGEVKGHPKSDKPHFGKGVAVMFPGNRHNIGCYLTDLSRTPL